MRAQGFQDAGIEKFIKTVSGVFPHLPGNFEFISDAEKIEFFCKNKEYIYSLLENAKPDIDPDKKDPTFLTRFSLPSAITNKFSAVQSASATLTGL